MREFCREWAFFGGAAGAGGAFGSNRLISGGGFVMTPPRTVWGPVGQWGICTGPTSWSGGARKSEQVGHATAININCLRGNAQCPTRPPKHRSFLKER